MDWTTYKKSHREIRGVGLVAVSDVDALDAAMRNARRSLGLPADKVFHACDDSPEIQLALLQAATAADMVIRIGAVLYDSDDGILKIVNDMRDAEFTQAISAHLLHEFLPRYSISRLISDKDLEGSKQEMRLKRAVRSTCRSLSIHSPDICFCSAKENKPGSQLVQLDDAIIYNLYRLRRDAVELPELRKLLRSVERNSENVIRNLADLVD